MPLRFKPTGNRILVEPISKNTNTYGGIFLPEASRDVPCEGIVVARGPGKPVKGTVPCELEYVKIGSHVIYNRFEGDDVMIAGKMHKLFDAKELLAIME